MESMWLKELYLYRQEWFRINFLVLAGIELIFFLVAGTVQCFRFSVRMMLIHSDVLVVVKYPKLEIFHLPTLCQKAGAQKLGGSIARTADLN